MFWRVDFPNSLGRRLIKEWILFKDLIFVDSIIANGANRQRFVEFLLDSCELKEKIASDEFFSLEESSWFMSRLGVKLQSEVCLGNNAFNIGHCQRIVWEPDRFSLNEAAHLNVLHLIKITISSSGEMSKEAVVELFTLRNGTCAIDIRSYMKNDKWQVTFETKSQSLMLSCLPDNILKGVLLSLPELKSLSTLDGINFNTLTAAISNKQALQELHLSQLYGDKGWLHYFPCLAAITARHFLVAEEVAVFSLCRLNSIRLPADQWTYQRGDLWTGLVTDFKPLRTVLSLPLQFPVRCYTADRVLSEMVVSLLVAYHPQMEELRVTITPSGSSPSEMLKRVIDGMRSASVYVVCLQESHRCHAALSSAGRQRKPQLPQSVPCRTARLQFRRTLSGC